MVLSIFDQSRKDVTDDHILRIDDSAYGGDAEMEHILHRLTMAAADADMRHRMNVEDEYFSAIEKRDTEILVRDHKIAEQKTHAYVGRNSVSSIGQNQSLTSLLN